MDKEPMSVAERLNPNVLFEWENLFDWMSKQE